MSLDTQPETVASARTTPLQQRRPIPIGGTVSRIALVGAGHAHIAVLADWIANGLPCPKAVLVTPEDTLRYSGMVPGWLSGQYERDEGLVDIRGLAKRAGVDLVRDHCVGIDLNRRTILTGKGHRIAFDLASLNTGGVGRSRSILGDDGRVIDVRPIASFVDRIADWRARQKQADAQNSSSRIVVAGGGAGGVEIALGLRNLASVRPKPEIMIVTGREGLLPSFSAAVRKAVREAAQRQDIAVIEEDVTIAAGEVQAGRASLEPIDLVIAALGSAAPAWPRESGLACDAKGFVAVDRFQQSVSHRYIFAVGDIAARQDRCVGRSGVHAVFAASALAANLRACAAGERLRRSYIPRWNNLQLLATGDGSAIASYGPFAAEGRWVAWLKERIDRRWVSKYARLVDANRALL